MTELETLIRARCPIVMLLTWEEQRAVAAIEQLCVAPDLKRMLFTWTETEGWSTWPLPQRQDPTTRDPLRVLDEVLAGTHPAVYVLKDYHCFLREHEVVRRLRDCVAALSRPDPRNLVLLSPVQVIPGTGRT